jgi:Flp pilus assembly secretin CpaC
VLDAYVGVVMARSVRAFILLPFVSLAALFSIGGAMASNEPHRLRVELDYARLARMPEGAQTFILGNPLIADITMLKESRLMVVTGKSFGTTNLIMLDRAGKQVGESLITVIPPEDKLVVYRGSRRESLSCKPRCVRAVDMADDTQIMSGAFESVKIHDGAVSSLRK